MPWLNVARWFCSTSTARSFAEPGWTSRGAGGSGAHSDGTRHDHDHIPVHGMLDPDILTRMMHEAGASSALVRRHLSAIVERARRFT